VTSLGSIFFGLLSWLTWINYNGKSFYILLILSFLFSIFSIWAFYLFITIRTVKISRDYIRFSFFVLPFHRTYLLSNIKRISQESKNVEVNNNFLKPLTFKYLITVFELPDNKTIKVNSIGFLDYEELTRCFYKITRGNGQYIPRKRKFLLYILDNFEGSGLVILSIILTIGLAWALINR